MLEVSPDPSWIFFSLLIYFLITAQVMNMFMSQWYIHSVTYICHRCSCASHFCGGVGDENKTVFGTINVSCISMDVACVKLKNGPQCILSAGTIEPGFSYFG